MIETMRDKRKREAEHRKIMDSVKHLNADEQQQFLIRRTLEVTRSIDTSEFEQKAE